MPKFTISGLGEIGLVTDIPAWKAPPNAFTALGNMRMEYGAAINFGQNQTLDTLPSNNPYHLIPFNTGVDYYWIIQGDSKIYAWDGTSFIDITSTLGYSSFDEAGKWSGSNMGQILFSAHPNVYPEYWNGNILGQMQPLIYDGPDTWADLDIKCDVMRSFKNYGIALGITDGANYYPHLIKWSNPAAAGTIPDSWDHTNPANRAGENDLADQGGKLIDAVALRDAMVIYKENSLWMMTYISGKYVWSFKPITQSVGALSHDCITEIKGVHAVFSPDDIYQFNGANPETLIDKKIRQVLISSINSDYAYNSFVVNHRPRKEIFFCFPHEDNQFASMAIIWNWKDNTFSVRELDDARHIASGTLISPPETWDDNPGMSWDNWIGPWGSRNYDAVRRTILGCDVGADLAAYDVPLESSTPDFRSYVERTDLVIDDLETVNIVTEMWPVIESTKPVKIEIGSQMTPKGPVTWEQPFTFQPGVDRKIACRSLGALHAYRISSETKEPWRLTDIEFHYEPTGVR